MRNNCYRLSGYLASSMQAISAILSAQPLKAPAVQAHKSPYIHSVIHSVSVTRDHDS